MMLIAGLGNPGPRYALNRHNIGFMAADAIHARHALSPWRNRFRGLVAEGQLGAERVLLLKPETYMNESGRAVAEAARFYKLPPADIWVFHDELDLAPGKVRVKVGGGVAGHNGLRSIDACLGTREFGRVRLGIGHPGHRERVVGYVLSDLSAADRDWLEPLLDDVTEAAPLLAEGNAANFMNRVALLTRPPEDAAESARTS